MFCVTVETEKCSAPRFSGEAICQYLTWRSPVLPLSQTAGYAVLALSCLEGPGGKPVRVAEVAERTGIPRPYLANVMHSLAEKGLIIARRGHKGGVTLSEPAVEICLAIIAEAVDGTSWREACLLGFSECSDERACPAHTYWKVERERVFKLLLDITLADISKFERHDAAARLVDARPVKAAKAEKPVKPAKSAKKTKA